MSMKPAALCIILANSFCTQSPLMAEEHVTHVAKLDNLSFVQNSEFDEQRFSGATVRVNSALENMFIADSSNTWTTAATPFDLTDLCYFEAYESLRKFFDEHQFEYFEDGESYPLTTEIEHLYRDHDINLLKALEELHVEQVLPSETLGKFLKEIGQLTDAQTRTERRHLLETFFLSSDEPFVLDGCVRGLVAINDKNSIPVFDLFLEVSDQYLLKKTVLRARQKLGEESDSVFT